MFESHIEAFGKLVHAEQPNMRRIGICVFDELLENLREHGQRFHAQLMTPIIQFCTDPSPEVRQASVYGLGLFAQFGGAGFAQSASPAMQNIYGLITHAQVRRRLGFCRRPTRLWVWASSPCGTDGPTALGLGSRIKGWTVEV